MSEIDKAKETEELKIYNTALKFCLDEKTHYHTKRILKLLSGKVIKRDKNDRPDIIVEPNSINHKVVGIEVFKVCKDSSKKGNKIISNSCKNKAFVEKTISSTPNDSYAIQSAYLETAKSQVNSGVEELFKAFAFHYNNHASNVLEYKEILEEYSIRNELAFLIDIEYNESDLFINFSNGKFDQIRDDDMPFFSDIVSIIAMNNNSKKIDYLIFYIHNFQNTFAKVVAAKPGNMRNNLKKQGIEVIDYLGENLAQAEYSVEENLVMITITCNHKKIDNDTFKLTMNSLYEKALYYQQKNKPFITSRMVQHMLYVKPKIKIKSDIDRLSKEFSQKYKSK